MEPIVWEWINLMVRWLHVVTAIAWIGSSFYFIHLDASLRRREGCPPGRRAKPGRSTAAASTTWSSSRWRRPSCRTA